METMRLAHLSDPHLLDLTGTSVLDFLNKRWIGGLNLISSRAREHRAEVFDALVSDVASQGIDHVLCTGDITNVALPSEFAFARGRFETFAHDATDVTVLPGNHDTYVPRGVPLFAEAFAPYFTPDPGWEHDDGDADPWPIVRVRGPLAIIGCNSAKPSPWFTAYGRVGAPQLARLRRILADERLADKVRVVAIHHPVVGRFAEHSWHGLKDWRELGEVIAAAGAELVVHGHEHKDLCYELPGPSGPVPVQGVHSATYVGARHTHRARYRIYTVERDAAGHAHIASEQLRMWDDARDAFVDDGGPTTPVLIRPAFAPVLP